MCSCIAHMEHIVSHALVSVERRCDALKCRCDVEKCRCRSQGRNVMSDGLFYPKRPVARHTDSSNQPRAHADTGEGHAYKEGKISRTLDRLTYSLRFPPRRRWSPSNVLIVGATVQQSLFEDFSFGRRRHDAGRNGFSAEGLFAALCLLEKISESF